MAELAADCIMAAYKLYHGWTCILSTSCCISKYVELPWRLYDGSFTAINLYWKIQQEPPQSSNWYWISLETILWKFGCTKMQQNALNYLAEKMFAAQTSIKDFGGNLLQIIFKILVKQRTKSSISMSEKAGGIAEPLASTLPTWEEPLAFSVSDNKILCFSSLNEPFSRRHFLFIH